MWIYLDKRAHTHTHTHTYIRTYIHTYTHTNTNTHTHTVYIVDMVPLGKFVPSYSG